MNFQENIKEKVNKIDFDAVKSDVKHFAHDVQDFAQHKAENVKDTLTESVEKLVPLALAAYGGIKTFYGSQKEKYSSDDSSNGVANALLFVAGAAIGATVGILLAPAKGSETRERISGETKRVVANAEAKGRQLAEEAQAIINKNAEVAKAKFQEGKQKATAFANDARQRVNSNSNSSVN